MPAGFPPQNGPGPAILAPLGGILGLPSGLLGSIVPHLLRNLASLEPFGKVFSLFALVLEPLGAKFGGPGASGALPGTNFHRFWCLVCFLLALLSEFQMIQKTKVERPLDPLCSLPAKRGSAVSRSGFNPPALWARAC